MSDTALRQATGWAHQSARLLTAAAAAWCMAAPLAMAQDLPDPGSLHPSGIPYSTQYDDAYSYSTRLLDYLQPGAGWSDSAGTGLLDVIITTRSSGQTNSGGALAGYNIPDPITNPNTNPINDTWGGGGSGGLMRVQDLYNYLWNVFQANTPVFTFDQNETGGNPDLRATAKVEIISGVNGDVLKTWAFDGNTQAGDGQYDPLAWVTAPGEICLPDDIYTAAVNDPICFNNNVGSGKFDGIIYVPTMNLTDWFGGNGLGNVNNLFKVSWAFDNVDDGGEEITLTGRFTGTACPNPSLPQCQTVPEPTPLALLAIGLLGLWTTRRRWH